MGVCVLGGYIMNDDMAIISMWEEESNFSLHANQEGEVCTHQTLWLHHQQRTEDEV